jgi:hypothetical protein
MLWYKLGWWEVENSNLGLFGSLYIDSLAINLGENKGVCIHKLCKLVAIAEWVIDWFDWNDWTRCRNLAMGTLDSWMKDSSAMAHISITATLQTPQGGWPPATKVCGCYSVHSPWSPISADYKFHTINLCCVSKSMMKHKPKKPLMGN